MKKLYMGLLAAVLVVGLTASATPSYAWWGGGWRGGWVGPGWRGGWARPGWGYGWRGWGPGVALGAAAVGVGVGLAASSAWGYPYGYGYPAYPGFLRQVWYWGAWRWVNVC